MVNINNDPDDKKVDERVQALVDEAFEDKAESIPELDFNSLKNKAGPAPLTVPKLITPPPVPGTPVLVNVLVTVREPLMSILAELLLAVVIVTAWLIILLSAVPGVQSAISASFQILLSQFPGLVVVQVLVTPAYVSENVPNNAKTAIASKTDKTILADN